MHFLKINISRLIRTLHFVSWQYETYKAAYSNGKCTCTMYMYICTCITNMYMCSIVGNMREKTFTIWEPTAKVLSVKILSEPHAPVDLHAAFYKVFSIYMYQPKFFPGNCANTCILYGTYVYRQCKQIQQFTVDVVSLMYMYIYMQKGRSCPQS